MRILFAEADASTAAVLRNELKSGILKRLPHLL
ncbi:hypothetical protein J2X36_004756 [Methylobacterium sp. BE186]|nr:hypothetical protein [Methylobacterium sp. BE186]